MIQEVDVNLDKIMKELWQKLTYKNAVVLKLRLEGKTNKEIMQHLGLTTEEAITGHLKKIKEALGISGNSTYLADMQLGMICYERGYVTIKEDD